MTFAVRARWFLCLLAMVSAHASLAQEASGPTAADYMAQGEDMLKVGNNLGAAWKFEHAIQKAPTNVDAYVKLGQAYTEMGSNTYASYFSKAESTYTRMAAMAGKEHVEYRKGLAKLALAQWNVDDAIAIYDQLAAQYPDSCEYLMLLGEAQRLKGLQIQEVEGRDVSMSQLDVAETTIRKAMELCPNRIEPIQLLAQIKDTRKNYQEVVDLYADLYKKDPEDVRYLRGYAIALFNVRNWELTAEHLGKLLKKDPIFAERMMYISALRKLGRMDEAAAQEFIARQEAPKEYGPVALRLDDVLREKLAIQSVSEQAVARLDKNDCAGDAQLWKEARTKVEPYLQDEEMKSAAEDLIVFLDRRILYAESYCK